LRVPHSEAEYDSLVAWLDELIDVVGNDENHPLATLMDVIGTLIEAYEEATLPDFP
jgi:HTH-type transcriptional regulator/antitoxin HigA